MTSKKAALKLLSCGLRFSESEDRAEVIEAIAWAVWALMEQARYEEVDDSVLDQNEEEYDEVFEVGDRVMLISHGDRKNIRWEPEIGTVGTVQVAGNDNCVVQWPDKSTKAGLDGSDDCWSVANYKLKKIP